MAEIMQRNIGPLVCLLIIVMDVIAGILAIKAEVAQSKVNKFWVWNFECRDPSYEAFELGFAAAALLIIAHAISNLLGGCIFVYSKGELKKASSNKQLAIASLIFSWITLAIGFVTLATGALSNIRSRRVGFHSIGYLLRGLRVLYTDCSQLLIIFQLLLSVGKKKRG